MKQSKAADMEKFDDIISELQLRGIIVLMHRPTRWGYVVDAVIPSAKIIILRTLDMNRQTGETMSMFFDMTNRLQNDGYRVVMVPKRNMNKEQIGAFCDRISVDASPAVA